MVRNVLTRTLMVASVVLGSLAVVSPAQAADTPTYQNRGTGQCIEGSYSDNVQVPMYRCDGTVIQDWEIEERPQPQTGQMVVKLRNIAANKCLDSGFNGANQFVYTKGCNTGNYQLWEVFINSNGTRTFKSWGAWVHHGQHLCLSTNGVDRSPLVGVCNAANPIQQWYRQS
jgi:hypothetical protein